MRVGDPVEGVGGGDPGGEAAVLGELGDFAELAAVRADVDHHDPDAALALGGGRGADGEEGALGADGGQQGRAGQGGVEDGVDACGDEGADRGDDGVENDKRAAGSRATRRT